MYGQIAFRRLLQSRFKAYRAKNPRLSMRTFSKKTGVGSAALSLILAGKRNVSRKLATKVLHSLVVKKNEIQAILRLFPDETNIEISSQAEEKRFSKLGDDHYQIIADWYHYAILSLLKVENFNSSPDWIAGRLGISESEASEALQRLIRVGLIKQSSDGTLVRSYPEHTTTHDVPNMALRESYGQYLDLIREAVNAVDIKDRDFSNLTMAIDTAKLPVAKELIRKFRRDLGTLLEAGPAKDVYEMDIFLYPLRKQRQS